MRWGGGGEGLSYAFGATEIGLRLRNRRLRAVSPFQRSPSCMELWE